MAVNEFEGLDGDLPEALTADGLATELTFAVECNMAAWLVEAVVSAVTTDDLLYLQRQVSKHTGWVKS